MRKLLISLLILLMLPFTCALADQAAGDPVCLDHSTIIHGDLLYYSGSVDGGELGVYIMNADGSDARMISPIDAALLAVSDGNLLIYYLNVESEMTELAVLRPDGMLTELGVDFGGKAVAADGRFYWGMGSCASDGSDVRTYFDGETASPYDYYPMAVHEGYLYYLDWSEMSEVVYSESSDQPMGAALCRLNLADGSAETISPVGSYFIGIENNLIYYTRNNFWYEVDFGMDSAEYEVDEGLFCTDLNTLSETRLASYSENSAVTDSYCFVQDGVVYGLRSDYSGDEALIHVLRLNSDGSRLPDLMLDPEAQTYLYAVQGDTLYAAASTFTITEDDFIQKDRLIAIRMTDGEETVLNPDSMDMLFYSESNPAVRLVNGRIYFSSYDLERWSLCLKSMNPDGSNIELLAYGISYAEG